VHGARFSLAPSTEYTVFKSENFKRPPNRAAFSFAFAEHLFTAKKISVSFQSLVAYLSNFRLAKLR
jgi:hypothetical protein